MPETTGKFTFKAGEFNHVRGWEEWASPAYESLPPSIHQLVLLVNEHATDLRQKEDLDMPWPELPLRGTFSEVPSELLATAARVVFYHGHWSPSGHWLQPHGTYWKFANYADQILSERLGFPRQRNKATGNGAEFVVNHGALRVYLSSPASVSSLELGLATEEIWERFGKLIAADSFPGGLNGHQRLFGFNGKALSRTVWSNWEHDCMEMLRKHLGALRPTEGPTKDSFDFSRFLVKE